MLARILLTVGLIVSLPAQRELLDKLPPEAEAWDHRIVTFGPEFESIELPGKGPPRGLAHIGGRVWLARGERLLRLTWPKLELEEDVESPKGLRSLCADERFLYGLADGEVIVLDAFAGREVRRVRVNFARVGRPHQLEVIGSTAERGQLIGVTRIWRYTVSLTTGEARTLGPLPAPRRSMQWLAFDGARSWYGWRRGVAPLKVGGDPDAWSGTAWPWGWATRCGGATWIDGRLLLAIERSDRGHVGEFVAGVLTPDLDEQRFCLTVAIFRREKGAKWVVGPKALYSLANLRLELERLAQDPKSMTKRTDGTRGPMPVFVESHPQVTIAEVKATWDAATAAGFDIVRCPPIEAWVRAQRARKKK